MLKNIYTGGPCTVGEGQQSNNPFRQFMNQVIFGKAQQGQIQQQMNVQQNQAVNQSIEQRQQMYSQMNSHWEQLAQQFDQASLDDRVKMERIYQEEQIRYMEMQQFQQFQMQQHWQEAQQQYEADQLAQEYKFNEIYENAEQEEKLSAQYAGDMMQVMMNDPDPKFQQSKFLGFLQQLNSGQIKIRDKELVDKQNAPIAQTALERNISLDEAWDKATKENLTQDYEKFWNQKVEAYEQELKDDLTFEQKLELEYQKILQQMDQSADYENLMTEAWQKASDLQEFEQFRDANEVYHFQAQNPFLQEQFPLQIALQLVNQGNNTLAILALEAHLQKTANDSNSWRILGRLHQDNDSDQKAVSAFLNAYKYNPNDLDTLSSLGVSCTNILDEVRAMNYLKQWLMKNPNYKVNINDQIVPDNTTMADYRTEDLQRMNAEMIDVYQQAIQQNPNDVELISGLAVLFFIQRNYQDAVVLFKKALQIEPNNYQIWNKLGATVAHLGEADQAMFCYHRALDLRPNFVRVWVNLAFAYSFKNQYADAARLYLNALTINPNAKHIWGYLQTAFMQLQRSDLVAKIQHYDPSMFANEFQITDPKQLPEPEILYQESNLKYIFKMPEEQWIKEFQQQK